MRGWGGQRFLLLLDSFKAAASFRRGPPGVHFGTDLFLIFHISFSIYFFSKWWNQGAAVLIVALLRSQPPCCVWGDLLSDRRVELLAVYCPRDESLMSGSFCTSTPNYSFVDLCLYYVLLYVTNYLKGVLQTRPEQWKEKIKCAQHDTPRSCLHPLECSLNRNVMSLSACQIQSDVCSSFIRQTVIILFVLLMPK